jgi:hypothetical protein
MNTELVKPLEKTPKISDMIPEILDTIGEFAGTYFSLAVGRKPSSRQLLHDGGVGKVLEQILETGGDFRMLFSVRQMYPDPELPILKAINTRDPILCHRVCTTWNTWYSNIGYSTSYYTSFAWGLDNLQTDEKTRIHFEQLRNAKPLVPDPEKTTNPEEESEYETEESTDDEGSTSDEEESNPYIRSTLEERLDVTTSRGVTDVNDVVCDFTRMHGFLPQELRKFIEVNGVQHMKKIHGNINFRGPHEHIIWLINLCVDLGYIGKRLTVGSPYIESGVIHYKYPSTYDPEVACWMYFEGF